MEVRLVESSGSYEEGTYYILPKEAKYIGDKIGQIYYTGITEKEGIFSAEFSAVVYIRDNNYQIAGFVTVGDVYDNPNTAIQAVIDYVEGEINNERN